MLEKQMTIILTILLQIINGLWRRTKQIQLWSGASNKDFLVEAREDEDATGAAAAPMDYLEVPPIVGSDEREINEDERGG